MIRGSAEFLRLQLADQPDLQVSVDPILRNAEVLKTRLEHLMATVRSRAPRLSEVNVRAILTEAAELFAKGSALRGCPVRVVTQLDDESLLMRADPGQLMLVVLSLLNNAHDAFIEAERTGGSIEIRARQCEADGMSWVTITVQDDGPGVPEPALARIFEPFFTTKEHGTGYGLYLALETMKEQRGRITVESLPGAGACFTIWIPGSSQAAGLT
ncbi:MAG: ATP-binding protein [Isosphaeraceae bacterium]